MIEPGLPPSPHDRHLWQIRWVRDLMVVLLVLVLLWVASKVQAVLVPVLIGLALAYAFNPLVTWAQRRLRIARWATTVWIMGFGLLIVVALLAWFGPLLIAQISGLIGNLPRYMRRLAVEVQPFLEHLPPEARAPVESLLPITRPPAAPPPAEIPVPPGVYVEPLPVPEAQGVHTPRTVPHWDYSVLGNLLMRSLNLGLNFLGTTLSVMSYLVLAGMVTLLCFFFFSWRFDRLILWFEQFIPVAHRARTEQILRRMDASVSAFIRGRMLQSLLLGANLSILWGIAGVPYFLLLGMASGLLNLVPYLSFLGWPIAILLVWIDTTAGGGAFSVWKVLVWPSLAYILAQQLDNWVVEPLVQGKATNLDPLTVLLAVLVGATLMGLLGMLLAIPVAACGKILAQELLLPRLRAWAQRPASSPSPLGRGQG